MMSISVGKKSLGSVLFIVMSMLIVKPAAVTAADEVHFVYKFTPDYSREFKGEFESEQNFYGRNMVMFVEMEFTEKCVEVSGDTLYTMEVTFNNVSSSIRMDDNLTPNKMDEALKGQVVTFKINKYGEISDLKAKSYITGWRNISGMLNNVISTWYPHLPDKSYGPGQTWTDERTEHPEAAQGMEVKLTTNYDFKEIKKEKGISCARVEGEETSNFSGKTVNSYGEFNTNGESKAKFEFLFDGGGTCIVKFKASMQMDMKMVDASDSPGKKEETESHLSYEMKKEIK